MFSSDPLFIAAFLAPLMYLLGMFAYAGPVVDVNLLGYVMSLATMAFFAFSALLMWPIYRVLHWLRGPKKLVPAAAAVVAATPQEVAG